MPRHEGIVTDDIVAGRALEVRVLDTVDAVEDLTPQWDRLAVANRAPYAAPAWCLAWWRHVAPSSARLRVVVVTEADALIALAPLYCLMGRLRPVRYRFIGATVAGRMDMLCEPGAEASVASAITRALATHRTRPDVIEFEGLPARSPWPALFRQHWPRQAPVMMDTQTMDAPAVTLTADYDAWLADKSRNFRQQARRHKRRLEADGAAFTLVDGAGATVTRLTDFARLHEARWRYRGGSGVLDAQVLAMLRATAAMLAGTDRFRLHLIGRDGEVISALLVMAAGGEASYWLSGFDEDWASEQPSMQALLAAIEHAVAVGDTRFDLGPGTQSYKLRLSDTTEELRWTRLFPPGPRRPLVLANALVERTLASLRQRSMDTLSDERKNQIKRWLRRLRG